MATKASSESTAVPDNDNDGYQRALFGPAPVVHSTHRNIAADSSGVELTIPMVVDSSAPGNKQHQTGSSRGSTKGRGAVEEGGHGEGSRLEEDERVGPGHVIRYLPLLDPQPQSSRHRPLSSPSGQNFKVFRKSSACAAAAQVLPMALVAICNASTQDPQ